MFISRFKYKIEKAKIIKIIYCNEHVIREKEYQKEMENILDPFRANLDPFSTTPTTSFHFYDKHDSFGNYRNITYIFYDYKMIVEYSFKNITYRKEIVVSGISRVFKENKNIKVYFERKNPNIVYFKPILKFYF